MNCSFCNEYVSEHEALSCDEEDSLDPICWTCVIDGRIIYCSFCHEYVSKHQALSCDNEHCLYGICWTCYDEGMMRTLCCEKTYCRLCNIGEFVECCGCGVDICPSCQVDCKMCENKLCTSCCDSTMATYCEKSGEYICNRCT